MYKLEQPLDSLNRERYRLQKEQKAFKSFVFRDPTNHPNGYLTCPEQSYFNPAFASTHIPSPRPNLVNPGLRGNM
jgi:hypothetical protein